MRILTVLSTFPPHFYGGGEVAAMNLSRWLSAQGHEVGFVTVADKTENELHGAKVEGMHIWRLRFPRPYMFWNHNKVSKWLKPLWYLQDFFDPRNRSLMGLALDQFKPDIVQIHVVSGIGINSLRAVAKREIPAVFFLHDLNLACFPGGMFRNGALCKRQCLKCRFVSRIRFKNVASIPRLAFCSPSRANLEKAGSVLPLSRFITAAILNPVKYPQPTAPKTKSAHVRFLYVGRLHATKGVDFLLTMLDQLSKDFQFTIDILGDGPQSSDLRASFATRKWCRFRGHVSEEDVSNFMEQSDALCTPSIWAEPLGGVVVQALAQGLPVLGSAIGGIPELIEHNRSGQLIPAGDRGAWVSAIKAVLENPSQLAEWGKYAKANSQRFDQDVNGHKIIDLFEEVIGTSTADRSRR